MCDKVKFQSLELDQKYTVQQIDKPFKTRFGDSCILEVSEEKSDETFELFATKFLMKYITNEKPKKKFNFTVKEKDGTKYPVIEGYNPREWTKLK